ncbi:LLM class flavin-dependent oxidoreductase [Nocardioides lianchengensis]|uniref:Flavin-dependent oxidoreductase, luciferase family (Includes alkanesulfonate monooxygenase SsuD and methylene tetrahydromethanopterin reductase) n=1 Tax=Nocardioides lianchengensis TaxID=1045774 RepID=A0A1G7ATX1_9ACTN|nr:LLM class flavin-dependent oxidoreductase [Nocardioides lianchengensis]NYG13299.1 alkanesulfonate monooxygenase SsuD/methylene tetrahydromethanopterin reductase-like flavin-dependent oxidoreductase (luciferase family) [Nocardioides lianchengensis]SDE18318.1 Flavin-dependent oxidoreductase, luciferase family (includes alkanesulfonate monooxygenase SsuD and methylene tetrahydromethanopterin reductase) [Nocardioides lianchengensis]
MQVGMTLPVMEPDLWAEPGTLEAWARATDEGPFSSVCFGERMAFDNPETLTLLGAVAAWTSRVRITTTVVVPQLHDPVLLAKSLATGDRLSGGRLSVGLGVGGRVEDYLAVGADPTTQRMRELGDRAAVMRRVWGGERVGDDVGPVGPPPVQEGGPELLVGTMGPRTVRYAAGWADGLAGVTLDLSTDAVGTLFDLARASWAEAGRPAPRLTTSFWFALEETTGGQARAQVHRHLRHYMSWLPASLVDAMAPTTGFAGTVPELVALLRRFEDLGTDEVQLIPTGSAVEQVRRVADAVAKTSG